MKNPEAINDWIVTEILRKHGGKTYEQYI